MCQDIQTSRNGLGSLGIAFFKEFIKVIGSLLP